VSETKAGNIETIFSTVMFTARHLNRRVVLRAAAKISSEGTDA